MGYVWYDICSSFGFGSSSETDLANERRDPIIMEGESMVRGKVEGRTSRRTAWSSTLLAGLVAAAFTATPAWADKIHGKLRGTVDVPGTSLTLPLPPGSPNVIATLFLGGPSGPAVPFTITPDTKVDAEDAKEKVSGNVVTIVDGDSIEVKGKFVMGKIVAAKIKVENPQIEAFGAVDVPGMSLTLPLPPGSADVPITVFLGGIGGPPITVKITTATRVKGGPTLTLLDNDFVEFTAELQADMIIVKKIRKENPEDVEDK